MEFDQVKGFYYVAKLGSFTEAAAHLYISQPAISLQVKALEKQLGERLFDRSGRKIRLTHAGNVLYEEAEGLVEKFARIHDIVKSLKEVECGRLVLGASDTVSMYLLPDLLREFTHRHPRVELRITSRVTREVAHSLKEHEIDIGIITLPFEDEKLEIVPVLEQRFVAIVPPGDPFAARRSISPRDLTSGPLILLEATSLTRERIEAYLQRQDCWRRPAMELSNYEIIKRYVAAGLGRSLVPEGAVSAERDGVVALALRPRFALSVGVAQRLEPRLSHAARAFLELAGEYFRSIEATSAERGPIRN